jgi:adenosylcobinamide-GDP ribazoletransferase
MRNLISALQFITILPLGKAQSFDPPKMIPYFPLVGILLGLLVAGFDAIVVRFWTAPVAALLDIILLAVLTGAFHIDGLGDTADGLLGPRPRDKALEIMKDSRIGTMGLVAILFGLAIKWGGIASLSYRNSVWYALFAIRSAGRHRQTLFQWKITMEAFLGPAPARRPFFAPGAKGTLAEPGLCDHHRFNSFFL